MRSSSSADIFGSTYLSTSPLARTGGSVPFWGGDWVTVLSRPRIRLVCQRCSTCVRCVLRVDSDAISFRTVEASPHGCSLAAEIVFVSATAFLLARSSLHLCSTSTPAWGSNVDEAVVCRNEYGDHIITSAVRSNFRSGSFRFSSTSLCDPR